MANHSQDDRPLCPYCGSTQISKNGSTHHKKQKYLCKECRRQFIENPQKKYIQSSTKLLIKKLLLEKISLVGIARSLRQLLPGVQLRASLALQVSMTWLQKFVNDFYRRIPCQTEAKLESQIDLIIECDELWSFVKSKENAVYIWLAINRKSRQIVGVHFGNRSRDSAQEFWDSLPQEYRERALVYTDLWLSYQEVIPPWQHQPSSKKSGETNHIERFNNTLRQRCSRLVRKTLSFSKNFFNHEGAIWYFVHHYNEELLTS